MNTETKTDTKTDSKEAKKSFSRSSPRPSPHALTLIVLVVAALGAYVTFVLSYCGALVCKNILSASLTSDASATLTASSTSDAQLLQSLQLGQDLANEQLSAENSAQLQIGDATITVQLATTSAEQELGLGNRTSLDPQTGMWFVLATPNYQGMWMKDMNFSLDMIWVDQNMRIVDIAKDVTPDSYPHVFLPSTLSSYVLEVNAGFADAHGVRIGQFVSLGQ